MVDDASFVPPDTEMVTDAKKIFLNKERKQLFFDERLFFCNKKLFLTARKKPVPKKSCGKKKLFSLYIKKIFLCIKIHICGSYEI